MMRKQTVGIFAAVLLLVGLCGTGFADAYSDAVTADSPVAYWRLNDATVSASGVVEQISGRNMDYWAGREPTVGVSGVAGTAFEFDGSMDFVQRNVDSALVPGTGNFTIETWVKTTVNSADAQSAVCWNDGEIGGGRPSFYYLGVENGKAAWKCRGATNTVYGLAGTINVADGNWHHLVGIYDRTNDRFSLYVDGASDGSIDNAGLSDMNIAAGGPGPFRIGAATYGDANFNGSLDEVAMYSSALTGDQVAAHYNAVPEPATMALLAIGGVAGVLRRRK